MAGFMALHGVPVLVYDHPGVGERREYLNPVSGLSAVGQSPSDEHNHTGTLALLAGIPPCRLFIAEAAQAVAFLASFPFVDRARIGFTGASGGGTLSCMAGAYMEGIAFAAPVCIIGDEATMGSGDAEQQRPSSGRRGVALVDLLAALVPRPAMVVCETGFEATAHSVATLRRLYALAGAPQAVAYAPIEDVHGYTHPMVQAVYAFLAEQFDLPPMDLSAWTRLRTLSAAETWCTPSGCILRDRPQTTLQEQIARLVPAPSGLTTGRLAGLLGLADLERSPVPALCPGPLGERVVVTGMSVARPGEIGLIDWQDKAPEWWGPSQAALYRSVAARHTWRLNACGGSILGLHVRQILDVAAERRGQFRELAASGAWSVPLALACALAPPDLLPKVRVRDLPASYRMHLSAGLHALPVQSCVPGLLAAGDLDDVVDMCGGRLEVENRIDAAGRSVR